MLLSLPKSLLAAILLSVIALLVLSACGGDDDDEDSGDGGGNAPTATADPGDDGDDDGEEPTDDADGDDGEEPTDDADGDLDGNVDSELGELACSLLTPEDIKAVIDATVGEGEPSSIAEGFGDCRWDGEGFNSVSASVVVGRGAEALFDLDLGDDQREDVDGLGDRAHYLGGFLPFLEFLQDGVYVSISVATDESDEEVLKEQAIELGHIASDNLP